MRCSFRRLGLALLNGVIFAGTAVLACAGIHRCLPIPALATVQPKLEYLKAHVNDYDTLFIGTSRVYRQIMPSVFDREAAGRGITVKSFNAGVDGVRPPEDAYLFDQIRGFRPSRLRWVFVELWWIRVAVDSSKRGTYRLVYWHDWDRLVLLFQQALQVKRTRHLKARIAVLWDPMMDFCEHVPLFLENLANIGRGAMLLETLRDPERPRVSWGALGPEKDGFLENNSPGLNQADRQLYETAMAKRAEDPAVEDYGTDVDQDALRCLMQKIEKLGATPVLIIPPTTSGKNFYPRPEPGASPIVLDFSDMKRYPALFEERYRVDTNHLNRAGAELFTRLVAEEFARAAKPAH